MDKDYLLLFGSISHGLFALLFLLLINFKNIRRIFLIVGHILVSTCFMVRFLKEYNNEDKNEDKSELWPYIGIIGHGIICLFFIAVTIIDKVNYRIVSTKIYFNMLCILGQIGMIIHYITIKMNIVNHKKYIDINTITTFLLFIFYIKITLKQKKEGKILILPLLFISLLYLGFLLRNLKNLRNKV